MSIFYSILYKNSVKLENKVENEPDFFVDLNLNQVIEAIIAGKEEYNLKQFFYSPLYNIDEIIFRQQIMSDIENPIIYRHLTTFTENIKTIRKQLAFINKLYYPLHQQRLYVDVVKLYCETITILENNLSNDPINSEGLKSFYNFIIQYINSDDFLTLTNEIKQITSELSTIKYCVNIKGLQVQVLLNSLQEKDYQKEIEDTFSRFKQKEAKNYKVGLAHPLEMNHVEAQILDGVAQLYPEIFSKLASFYTKNQDFFNETINTFDREIQFYISYIEYISTLRKAELNFCYPLMTNSNKEIFCKETYDIALAHKLVNHKSQIVSNDFSLSGNERILVISGPNQSGKTTFARMFGQIHYLAALGCPIPGSEAKLFLFDQIYTHFERKENIKDLRGKLEDDLFRINKIITRLTPHSIIIMNEIFSSTSLNDAIYLGKQILTKITEKDAICVWVTFIDELSKFNEKTVSMVGNVSPENPDNRTYKIVKKPADGLAYALSIAKKYRLTYEQLNERLQI